MNYELIKAKDKENNTFNLKATKLLRGNVKMMYVFIYDKDNNTLKAPFIKCSYQNNNAYITYENIQKILKNY